MREQHQNGASNGAHHRHLVLLSPEQLNRFALVTLSAPGSRYKAAVTVLGVLFLGGIVGFVMRLAGGFEDRAAWGYYTAVVVYIFLTMQAAPIVAFALRAAKGHWRRPVSRVAELFGIVGVFNAILFLPVLALVPSIYGGRLTFWFEMNWLLPWQPPSFFLFFAMVFLAVIGLTLLYLAAMPDLAAARDMKGGIYRALARGWLGTTRQWKMIKSTLNILGAFYLMFFVFVSSLISLDLSMTLVPGWKDAIYPAFHSLSGLQGAVATTIVAMAIMRWTGGLRDYLHMEQFWALSKPMLAISLLWFYMWWATFLTYWYGRTPAEQAVLQMMMFGPYFVPFALAWSFKFLIPFLFLIWNRVRMSILGPTLIACSILIGNFFETIRLYVGPASIEEVGHRLEHVPATRLPDFADILIIVGAISGAILVYLITAKVIPALSIWDTKEGMLLTRVQPYRKTDVLVIGKPE